MSTSLTEQSNLTRAVEFKGHLIDSLTLSKVIDRIQQLGGDYRINDIRVGSLKKDISSLHLTLTAPNEETLNQLVSALKDYGGVFEDFSAETIACTEDSTLPNGAYEVRLPKEVFLNGQWQPIEEGGCWTLAIRNDKAEWVPVSQLKAGDAVIHETHGLAW